MNIAGENVLKPASRFPAPDSGRGKGGARAVVEPVFLPFFGCPNRCIYCSQNAQTGVAGISLDQAFDGFCRRLEKKQREGAAPFEVAFYGGTFTMLPGDRAEAFTTMAGEYAKKGLVTKVRCSTRPDATDPDKLSRLKECGLNMVELGVQSFDNRALTATRRGYDRAGALQGCRNVISTGLELGVQLMPGLPGDREGVFAQDVRTALETEARVVRLYPCLVPEGTELERMWRAGEFVPWTMERTVEELGKGVCAFWKAGVRVIRIGLAPQEGLVILAGPEHPALGQSVQARAVFEWVAEHLAEHSGEHSGESASQRPIRKLSVPRSLQGCFWGHKGELKDRWAALGITPDRVEFHGAEDFAIR